MSTRIFIGNSSNREKYFLPYKLTKNDFRYESWKYLLNFPRFFLYKPHALQKFSESVMCLYVENDLVQKYLKLCNLSKTGISSFLDNLNKPKDPLNHVL